MTSVYYSYMLEWRGELFMWMLSGLFPFVLMSLWVKAGQSGNFSHTSADFARYFLAVFVVRQITNVWAVWEVENDIVQGKLSQYLLQPVDPVWRHLLSHVGERFARLPFVMMLTCIFFVCYPDALWIPTGRNLLLGMLAALAAFLLRFLMSYTFGLMAFWTERAAAIEQVWSAAYLFLAGLVAPLDLYPPMVRNVAMLLPFPYVLYFPARLIAGQPVDWPRGFMVLFVWLLVFLVINRVLWRQGLKRHSAMGA